jgi:hypothetical protein
LPSIDQVSDFRTVRICRSCLSVLRNSGGRGLTSLSN